MTAYQQQHWMSLASPLSVGVDGTAALELIYSPQAVTIYHHASGSEQSSSISVNRCSSSTGNFKLEVELTSLIYYALYYAFARHCSWISFFIALVMVDHDTYGLVFKCLK